MKSPSASSNYRLKWSVGIAMIARLCINTARRFPYPFAPVLSRGLGVSLSAVTSMIATNQVTGILGLIFAPLGDRWGYRIMLLSSLGALTSGMFTAGLFPFYGTAFGALFMSGLGKSIFDPALQAYVGKRISYSRRGMVIGIIEMSWAGSSLVGIPLIGLFIAHFGWRAPFFVLGGIGFLAAIVLGILMLPDRNGTQPAEEHLHVYRRLPYLVQKRTTLGAIGFVFCISAANDNLFVVYGAWFEESYDLGIAALGIATTVIGAAELFGEILTATLGDRFGLLRLTTFGAILSGLSYLVLPSMDHTLPLALTALFVIFLTVEFSIVTSLSLVTELLPDARATMMAGYLAAASMGRVIGAFIGGPVWMMGGTVTVGYVSACITGLGLLSLRWGLSGWQPVCR